MRQYLDLCRHILHNGTDKEDRTGTGTKSVFGYQMRFDLSKGFPLVTTKKMYLKGVIHELLWFLKGDTNIKYLIENGVHIWNKDAYRWYRERYPHSSLSYPEFIQGILEDEEFAEKHGNLGPIYGYQWRCWGGNALPSGGEDQISKVIEQIKNNPDSRRLIVSAWNVSDLPFMALPPCHVMFQFYVADGKLSCQLYQRSADVFLGLPFNIASYSLLTMMIAHVTGLELGEFIHTIGDAHIYRNHYSQVLEQLYREPYPLPRMRLNMEVKNIFDFEFGDFILEDYRYWPAIKGELSV